MVEIDQVESSALEDQGWQRRSILNEPRLSEVVATYRELGLEVKLVDLDPATCGGCTTCFEGGEPGRFKVVYTRAA